MFFFNLSLSTISIQLGPFSRYVKRIAMICFDCAHICESLLQMENMSVDKKKMLHTKSNTIVHGGHFI